MSMAISVPVLPTPALGVRIVIVIINSLNFHAYNQFHNNIINIIIIMHAL